MARIYLATSWRNPKQPLYVENLREAGHDVYDFRHPAPGISGFTRDAIGLDRDHTASEYINAISTHPIAALGFNLDFRAMRRADTCVLLLPCGRSAHLELGWMSGAGKRTIIVTRDGEEPELMALLADEIVVGVEQLLEVLK